MIKKLIAPQKKIHSIFLAVVSVFLVSCNPIKNTDFRLTPEPSSAINFKNKSATGEAVVVTANPYASHAALDIISSGGNAIDATIAAQLVLGLVEPQSSGLGGGGFMLLWDAKQQKLVSIDGRETAPSTADDSLFLKKADKKEKEPMGFFEAVIGGRSVGAPGLVAMLKEAHDKHGKMDWSLLFESAIALADEGFLISERLNTLLTNVPAVTARSEMADYFFDKSENGYEPKEIGTVLVNKEYANVLRVLSRQPIKSFYSGKIAKDIIQKTSSDSNKGLLSEDDLANYKIRYRKPLCKKVFNYKFCGMGPPSSGGSTVLSILMTLESLQDNGEIDYKLFQNQRVTDEVLLSHIFIEASRLAFADRNTYIADPDYVEVPVDKLLSNLYITARANMIKLNKRIDRVVAGDISEYLGLKYHTVEALELESTTHLSVRDLEGNIVSMTTSIETAFGSRLMTNGFILNNQLTDFSFKPVNDGYGLVANRVEPGKRPTSSMSPMIVFDAENNPIMAIGSPGGRSIIGYVAKVLFETLVLNNELEEAVGSSHIVDSGSRLKIEDSADKNLINALNALKHPVTTGAQTSGLHVIQRNKTKAWDGVADPRREGVALAIPKLTP